MRLSPTPPLPEVEDFRDWIRGFMLRDLSTLRLYLRLPERGDVMGLDVDASAGELGWYVDTAVRTILADPHRGRLLAGLRRTAEDVHCAAAYDLSGGW